MVTLIGAPDVAPLDRATVARAAAAIGADVDVLADGIACDLTPPEGFATDALRAALDGVPVDIVVQPADGRRKRILVADMDSTMIRQECIDELAAEAGIGEAVAAITEGAMRGEIDFERSQRQRVGLLAGLEIAAIERVLAGRIEHASGAATLVRTMRAHGGYCALVSGGYTAFTGPVAAALGFDEHRANVLEDDGAVLTGGLHEPILGADAKAAALREIAAAQGSEPHDAIAVGDGANDLAMIALAGTGVALHAKPIVAEAAPHRIDHGDLTALLYIQGYRESDLA